MNSSLSPARGVGVTRPQLARWHPAGLLPAPATPGKGRGRGRESVYPVGSGNQVLALLGPVPRPPLLRRRTAPVVARVRHEPDLPPALAANRRSQWDTAIALTQSTLADDHLTEAMLIEASDAPLHGWAGATRRRLGRAKFTTFAFGGPGVRRNVHRLRRADTRRARGTETSLRPPSSIREHHPVRLQSSRQPWPPSVLCPGTRRCWSGLRPQRRKKYGVHEFSPLKSSPGRTRRSTRATLLSSQAPSWHSPQTTRSLKRRSLCWCSRRTRQRGGEGEALSTNETGRGLEPSEDPASLGLLGIAAAFIARHPHSGCALATLTAVVVNWRRCAERWWSAPR